MALLIPEYVVGKAFAAAKMSSKYGDVPLVVDDVDIDKGMSMGRTDLATVKQFVYDEFDAAANALPTTYSGIKRATKGTSPYLEDIFAYAHAL